jgi:peptidoglycan/LPS O-acetylase OafA/YrhL
MSGAAPEPGPKTPIHLQHVDGLRAIAALVVYLNHAYAQTWNPDAGQFPRGALSAFTSTLVAGHLSVAIFIAISGFCLGLPIVRSGGALSGGVKGFLLRRARRILPPYYGAVALCLALIATVIGKPTGTLWDVPIQVRLTSVIAHLLLVQDFFGTSSINYVFWSIAVEWQIYLVFPLLVACWRRLGPGRTTLLMLVIGYGLRLACAGTRVTRANPHFIGLFTLGMLAAHVACSPQADVAKRDRVPWGAIAGVCAALVSVVSYLWGWQVATERFYLLDLPTGIAAACLLVLSTAYRAGLVARVLNWKPLVAVGVFSYSLYLVHAPILQLLWQFLLHPAGVSNNVMFAFLSTLGLAIVLTAAYLFHRVLERPFMRAVKPAPAPVVQPAGTA